MRGAFAMVREPLAQDPAYRPTHPFHGHEWPGRLTLERQRQVRLGYVRPAAGALAPGGTRELRIEISVAQAVGLRRRSR